MGLLHLVEQHQAVRPAPHRLGELASLLVADVARWGADQSGHRVLLGVLAHVDADHRPFVVEQELRESLGKFGLAHTCGSEEQERTGGAVGVGDPGAGAAHRIRHRTHGFLLTDHTLAEFFLHPQEFLGLTFHEAAGRNAGPGTHDLRDVLGGDLLGDHATFRAGLVLEFAFKLGELAVLDAGSLLEVAVAHGTVGDVAQFVDADLEVTDAVEVGLLEIPAGTQGAQLLLVIGEVTAQLLEAFDRRRVGLLGQGHLLHLHAVDLTLQFVDLLRAGVDLHAQPRRSLVDEVDGLVRQEARSDVAVRERRGGHKGGVRDGDLVVGLVLLLEPAQDPDGLLDARLADQDLLEPAFERGVLLDVLAVLVEGGGSDHAQLAAGEHGFEHVARVHGALAGRTGPHNGVELVDERDDLSVGAGDLLQHGLQPLLELAPVLRAGNHAGQIQRDQTLVAQRFGHVAGDDALGEALDDGGLADAGFADEHRVVLGAPGQDLHNTPDLGVTADDRVDLALPRALGQVDAVLLQGLETGLGVLGGHPAVAGDLGQRVEQLRRLDGQQVGLLLGDADQQVLGGDIVVPALVGEVLSGLQHRMHRAGQ